MPLGIKKKKTLHIEGGEELEEQAGIVEQVLTLSAVNESENFTAENTTTKDCCTNLRRKSPIHGCM